MSHKKALEALDRTVRDLRRNARIFGGALILLSGDFRQTLPVISRSTPADELNACLKSSVLWRHLQKLNGKFKGEEVLLPRIPMIPIYAIRIRTLTINKAQSLQVCGLNLENPCFSHGQLYVACSRVGKPSDLFVYAPDGKTRNIVYPTALQ